ncbi:copper homeostasis protein CutC [Pseudoalteromonas shioyasakiensis]|uniref:copper homeostasis protein CutC n=1 Tax=Pseudoalteromonas shioyasakiensis TaxID=1190813 RepID=UPI001EFCF8A5|nr:copper homeostasis protein CutC [Pseudoalteromonas shioyasakiensis]MCG9735946.1 copper homeostasis protein CutC [Pseudoalteromonas shioyasakiensis]
MNNGKFLEVCLNEGCFKQLTNNISMASNLGAKRFELCSNLHLDGLTPSVKAIDCAVKNLTNNAELVVMIRPKVGSFIVSTECHQVMQKQIAMAANAGAHGVVFGAVKHGELDLEVTRSLVATAKQHGLKVTFHRAFDTLTNPLCALNELISLGVDRILTAGTPWQSGQSAVDGLNQLNTYLAHSANQIEIVMGGGVTLENAEAIWRLIKNHSANAAVHVHSCVHNENGVINAEAINKLLSKD